MAQQLVEEARAFDELVVEEIIWLDTDGESDDDIEESDASDVEVDERDAAS